MGFVSGNGSAEITETVNSKESIASRRVVVVEGDPQYAPGHLDEWQASVEDDPAFINFTPNGLVWIWEFFPDHKEKLEQGFDEFARDNALNINKRYLVQCKTVKGYKYASDRGSGADKDLDLYKPSTSDSYKYMLA